MSGGRLGRGERCRVLAHAQLLGYLLGRRGLRPDHDAQGEGRGREGGVEGGAEGEEGGG